MSNSEYLNEYYDRYVHDQVACTGGLTNFTLGKRSLCFPNGQYFILGCKSTPSGLRTRFTSSLLARNNNPTYFIHNQL